MRLSVVICTYNGSKYVAAQIRSILSQTVPVNEIIVCDDGSSDDTVELVKNELKLASFDDFRILSGGTHFGVSDNFLRGMKASTGDYVFCCDQDDIWCDDKVDLFMDAVNSTHKDLYFSDGYVVNADLTKRDYSLWESLRFSCSLLNERPMLEVLLSRCVVTGAAMLVSRRLIDSVDDVPDCWLHDGWFAMVAAVKDSIEPVNHKTFLYRQHGSNVVGAQSNSLLGRARGWMWNIAKQPDVRRQRLERYCCVRDRLGMRGGPVDGCISFWSQLDSLSSVSFVKGLRMIFGLLASGSYSEYYTGVRGAVRDFVWLLVR